MDFRFKLIAGVSAVISGFKKNLSVRRDGQHRDLPVHGQAYGLRKVRHFFIQQEAEWAVQLPDAERVEVKVTRVLVTFADGSKAGGRVN